MISASRCATQWRLPRCRPVQGGVAAVLRAVIAPVAAVACGPVAHIPPAPAPRAAPTFHAGALPNAPGNTEHLARALAPLLMRQSDERFALSRVVAVVHPARRVVAYHLLWRDDVHGAWIPGTIPTDEEVVWVGYDPSGAPAELWTYWHGTILHTPWRGRQVVIDVQWGKHGSLPRAVRAGDLPRGRTLNVFYAFTYALPDLLLGRLTRPGPVCFCHGYARYRTFDTPLLVADRLDAVVVARDARPVLRQVFGQRYSAKPQWPWRVDLREVKGVT